MARKKAGNAAALAALAALAYMNSEGRGRRRGDRDDAERVTGSRSPSPADTDDATYGEAMGANVGTKLGEEELAKKPVMDLGAIRDETGTLSRFRRNTETGEMYDPGVSDGGRSMINRQNAAAKRAGLSVDDYYASGKAAIDKQNRTFKRGGSVKKMASGGMASSASKRADGIAVKGKTRGKMY